MIFGTISYAQTQTNEKQVKTNHDKGKPSVYENKLKKKLNLTDEQKKKITDIKLNNEKTMIDLIADLAKAKLEMKVLLNGSNFNRNDYLAIQDKIMQKQNNIRMAVAKTKMDIYDLLDDSQKKIFIKTALQPHRFMDMKKHHEMMMKNKGKEDHPMMKEHGMLEDSNESDDLGMLSDFGLMDNMEMYDNPVVIEQPGVIENQDMEMLPPPATFDEENQ
jgi:hypothetical protein